MDCLLEFMRLNNAWYKLPGIVNALSSKTIHYIQKKSLLTRSQILVSSSMPCLVRRLLRNPYIKKIEIKSRNLENPRVRIRRIFFPSINRESCLLMRDNTLYHFQRAGKKFKFSQKFHQESILTSSLTRPPQLETHILDIIYVGSKLSKHRSHAAAIIQLSMRPRG